MSVYVLLESCWFIDTLTDIYTDELFMKYWNMNSFKAVSYSEDIVYISEKDCILKTQSCQCFIKQKHLHGPLQILFIGPFRFRRTINLETHVKVSKCWYNRVKWFIDFIIKQNNSYYMPSTEEGVYTLFVYF